MPGNASPVDSPTAPGPIQAGDQGFGDLATGRGPEQDTKRRTAARSRAQHDAVNKLDLGRHFFPGLKTQGAQVVMVCDEGFLLALTREHIGSAHFGQQRRW